MARSMAAADLPATQHWDFGQIETSALLNQQSQVCPARDCFKQPEHNNLLDSWEEQEAFWTLWCLFISYLHCSRSKAVAHRALKQSGRQTTTPLFQINTWEYPEINFQTRRGLVKVHGPVWFLLLIACQGESFSRASESPCAPKQDSQEDLRAQLQEAAFSSS